MTQEREQRVIWPQDMQDDAMVAGVGDDDFTNFLELDNEFQHFAAAMNDGHSGLDTPMGRLGFGNSANDLAYAASEQMNMGLPSTSQSMDYGNHHATEQPFSQYQQYQQMQMPPHYNIPPTPVSADMQAAKYTIQMGNNAQMLFNHQQVRELGGRATTVLTFSRYHLHLWYPLLKLRWTADLPCLTTGWGTTFSVL